LQVTLCSPKQLLQIILQDTFLYQKSPLDKSFSGLHPTHFYELKSRLQTSKNWVKPVQKNAQIVYLSAIPHQICTYTDRSAATVANSLADQLSAHVSDHTSFQIPAGLSPILLDHIDIQATSSGYLEFRLDDWAIADWLTRLSQPIVPLFVFSNLPSYPAKRSLPSLFSLQHAHARCCSLLRLAAQQQTIGLNWQSQPSQWQWTAPDPISWLTPEQQLWISHTSERQLIKQCLTILDELPWQAATLPENSQALSLKPSRIVALAQSLAEAFSVMHRHCQIWGALKKEGRDRQTAHLALILVTQRLLHGLLTGLGIIASEEL
jgi:hypothetical protein